MDAGLSTLDPTGDPRRDEASLIERARHDAGAFAVLYRLHYLAVVGYLFRRTGDAHAAEDLAADTFLAAMRALPRYQVTEVPLRMWLLRIATNSANRWARQRRRMNLVRVVPGAASALVTAADHRRAATEEAQAALLTLSPLHQTVLSLHYLESLSLEEVAAVLGCRTGTVKSRLARGRAAMKAELERRSNRHG